MASPGERDKVNPFEAPQSPVNLGAAGSHRPPWVIVVYAVYCGIGATIYGGLSFFAAADFLFGLTGDPARRTDTHVLVYVSAVSLAAAAIFAAGPYLPRRPWAWTYGLILMLLGITVTWPFVAFWFGRRTRRHFGRTAQ